MAGRSAEVFEVKKQLQEQKLLSADKEQEWDGQEHGREVGEGGDWLPHFASGVSSVSPKGDGEVVEHPKPASPDCW